jgi:predicted nucleotidyltransferase
MRRAVDRRRAERDEMIEAARTYARNKVGAMSIHAASVVGSVARGDFNQWSDVDVVIVGEGLPARFPDRIALFSDSPAGIEVFAYTPRELEQERERKNTIVLEAGDIGIDLLAEPEGSPRVQRSE